MKKSEIFSNPGLKIASLVIAFILWLIVMNVSDPVMLKTFSGVTVNFTNVSYLESRGLSYEVPEGFSTIDVTVRTHRSSVEKLTSSNITAVADLTQVVDFESDPVMVPVKVSVPGVSSDQVTVSPGNVQIQLEEMKSKDFVINTSSGESKPENGYEVGAMDPDPEQITIRGSGSLIDSIDTVQAEVDVDGLKSNADLSASLHIFDKNGNELTEIQKSYLTMNVDPENIKVHVTLYAVNSGVEIEAQTYGRPKEGYQVGEIHITPETVSLVGNDTAMSSFRDSGNKIVIDKESAAVDVNGATSDLIFKVDLNNYLPNGIKLAEGLTNTVVVEVEIIPYDSRSLTLDPKVVNKNNLGEGFNAVFNNSELNIRVRGSSQALEALSADRITASVDLGGKREGTYTVDLNINLPDGLTLVESVRAEVTITKNETVSGTS